MSRLNRYRWLATLLICITQSAGCHVVENTVPASIGNTSLTLIPPSPVTSQIQLAVRGAVHNATDQDVSYTVKMYWDNVEPQSLIMTQNLSLQPGEHRLVESRTPTAEHVGEREIIMVVESGSQRLQVSQPIEVLDSKKRTTGRIGGAWVGLYHWSETEGAPWNAELKKMTAEQWKELVRAMHEVGMNIIVLQEVFRHEATVGQHNLTVQTYPGKAFYPSKLYPGRVPIATEDPIQAILSEADRLGMHVFVGVGSFAWFDFGEESLRWHLNVADELWERYGHHKSFYGWYISEEIEGGLSAGARDEPLMTQRHEEIVHFFEVFRRHVDQYGPDKPVMLATNAHHIRYGKHVYPALLENLDILCPFAFHRMPADDMTGEQAAATLQQLCDAAGSHLWMDMEIFDFAPNGLVPRPIEGLMDDLNRFPIFEKILCYQFPGLMNAPWMSRHPGGPATIKLYEAYKERLETGRLTITPHDHLAKGSNYRLTHKPSENYPGAGESPLTDGLFGNANYRHGAWVGFEGEPLDLVIEVQQNIEISTAEIGFLQDIQGGVYLPQSVRIGFSDDGDAYEWFDAELTADPSGGNTARYNYAAHFDPVNANYIRVVTDSPPLLPSDHPASGKKRWTFVDEVLIR